jgi:hypothetical protein
MKIINYVGLIGFFALLGRFTRVMGFLNLTSLFTGFNFFFMAVLRRFCLGLIGSGCLHVYLLMVGPWVIPCSFCVVVLFGLQVVVMVVLLFSVGVFVAWLVAVVVVVMMVLVLFFS